MNKAIVVTHGDFANGVVSALEKIMGEQRELFTFSNNCKAVEELGKEIKKLIEEENIEIPVFFVDIKGGSCWRTAKLIQRELGCGIVFSGVNLPMLVQYVSKNKTIRTEEELINIVIEGSQKAISGEIL